MLASPVKTLSWETHRQRSQFQFRVLQEESPLCPAIAKEVEYLTHIPPVQYDRNTDFESSLSHQRIPMPSTNTADYWEKKGVAGLISRAVLRMLQCIFAIVVAALYGLDLQQATKKNARAGSSWVYAEFVTGLSMIVCIVHLFFTTAVWYWGLLDALVSILWLAQFGVSASIYLDSGEPEVDEAFAPPESRGRMRSAVWVNLISLLLWLATTIQGIMGCCARRKRARQKGKSIELGSVGEA
ncbi:hypothetical protein BFJ70_g16321 [Fusarium oxysporum]|nr:hypothetical protein BFJ70_g16321 [Fusarium oxysporum]